ncbi:MAG: Hpt domain-containing protein [Rhodospirillaceae bacterium]
MSDGLQGVVEGYVASMRPRGEDFSRALAAFAAAGAPLAELPDLIAAVHKFAGSAGSAGFMRLSAVAALIEIGLRGARDAGALEDTALAQILCLGEDFAAEIAGLAAERSSLLSGAETPVYAPFARPLRVLLAGLPEAVARMLSHVVEQRMGMAWTLPDAAMLAAVPAGRGPDFAVAAVAAEGLAFPVVAFAPSRFDAIAAEWPDA